MARPSPATLRILGGIAAGAGLVAWLIGFGVDQVLARLLALPADATLTTPGAPSDPEASPDSTEPEAPEAVASRGRVSKADLVRPILDRSMFDSAKVGGVMGEKSGSDGPVGLSDLDATLLATVVADPPEYSSALIVQGKGGGREDGGGKARGFGIGDDLFGEGTVVEILPRKVVIERSDGSREFIQMDAEAQIVRSTSGTLPRGDKEQEGGVEQQGENKFIVDAALLEKALANPEALASQIRVAPHKGADGKIDGYRLSGIRRDSLFKQLGVKNGDIVHTVNGQDLTSMSTAMSAYESLQNEKSFSFEITRRNQRQTFEYEVR